ncbi:pyridoxine 5'-phosphate synthase [Desulfohalobiaceae bacterium Ax17]|uniref:pyridoxine 5'-phosphate synthase n=1 Tax=Desulfovulcanus ferrireducens TaxID=2831190 RepID=UPI00207BC087|nr:pyridoxine 5'-phosphate synthase [Desulfovulcanus ferrireducens]MBT8762447.1 pyridoxine 5'-phosphate synthase [Desulfovulcanus ferrireducens]
MPVLVVNVDHIATLRQARLGKEPDPVTGAHLAELAGAHGIIVHLREDRRHIQDKDVELLKTTLKTNLHLEMAATEEMQKIALHTVPHMVCLVPEKRQELTTEGGLNCLGREGELKEFLAPIKAKGIKTSLFIDAEKEQIEAAAKIGTEYIEIHTGHYADAQNTEDQQNEFKKIVAGIEFARELGLKVNLGHGLNYHNILAFAKVPGICEYSIGHSIISRAVFVGMFKAVQQMVNIISQFVS